MMSSTNVVLIVIAVLFIAVAYYIFTSKSAKNDEAASTSSATKQMQLNAYERLILLVDRIALHNLISRLNQPGASSREMQHLLTQSIKEE